LTIRADSNSQGIGFKHTSFATWQRSPCVGEGKPHTANVYFYLASDRCHVKIVPQDSTELTLLHTIRWGVKSNASVRCHRGVIACLPRVWGISYLAKSLITKILTEINRRFHGESLNYFAKYNPLLTSVPFSR